MILKIEEYPHAFFKDAKGYLVFYYPYDAVKNSSMSIDFWRHETYSPEILNFKEGKEEDIQKFVIPFLKLIEYVLQQYSANKVILVPVPSSIASNDPNYSTVPRNKTIKSSRNRDDRCKIFCQKLNSRNPNLRLEELVYRKTTKKEKEDLTLEQQIESMGFNSSIPLPKTDLFILIDDVATTYTTCEAVKQILLNNIPNSNIVILTLALSKPPHESLSIIQE